MQLPGLGVKTVAVVWGIIAIWRGSVKFKWQSWDYMLKRCELWLELEGQIKGLKEGIYLIKVVGCTCSGSCTNPPTSTFHI